MADEEEYEYEWPDDQEGDGWGDDPDDENGGGDDDNPEIEIENSFYEGEANMKDNPTAALEFLERCVTLEEEQGGGIKHSFKAIELIVCICAKLGNFQKMKQMQQKLIDKISEVSRNDTEEAITNILDAVTKHMSDKPQQQMEIYFMTMDAIKAVNETLWFKVCLRLGKIYLDQGDFQALNELLAKLKISCRRKDKDSDQIMEGVLAVEDYDPAKSNLLLETFAIEIQMCQLTKDKKRMNRVYPKTTQLVAVINDPRVMGIIKECGGKMYMSEKKWNLALTELNDCFKNYQEGGNIKAKNVLVYVILASILAKSEVDYMASREAQVYSDDRDIVAISKLKNAYRNNDIKMIQSILNDKKNQIFSDPEFIMYLDDLLRNIRLSVLLFKVKPYDVVKLDFLAKELNISSREVRQLLSELILDGKLEGSIDATAGLLEITKPTQLDARYAAMSKWSKSVALLHKQIS